MRANVRCRSALGIAVSMIACDRVDEIDVQIPEIPFSAETTACLQGLARQLDERAAVACLYFEGAACVLTAELDAVEGGRLARSDWTRTCPPGQEGSHDLELAPGASVAASIFVVPRGSPFCTPSAPAPACDGSTWEPEEHASCLARIAIEYRVAEDGTLIAAADRSPMSYSGFLREELGAGAQFCPGASCDETSPACRSAKITVSPIDGAEGTVRSDRGGLACPPSCEIEVPQGRSLRISATGHRGALLGKWTGAPQEHTTCNATFPSGTRTSTCVAVARRDLMITAELGYLLTVEVEGEGAVRASATAIDDSAIDCGSAMSGVCAGVYQTGTDIELIATPSPDGAFYDWTECSGLAAGARCTIDIRAPARARAVLGYHLDLHVDGPGEVFYDDGTSCEAQAGSGDCRTVHAPVEVVTLRASPRSGSIFLGWEGGCASRGSSPICTSTITATTDVAAVFGYIVRGAVYGEGEIVARPDGAICDAPAGDLCRAYEHGTMLELEARPFPGSRFEGWRGVCANETTSICELEAHAPLDADAYFSREYELTVEVIGGGAVTSTAGINCTRAATSDCDERLRAGTIVTLDARADPGWAFLDWIECPAEQGSRCIARMDQAQHVRAAFGRRLDVELTGGGEVRSPAGISCGSDCTEIYAEGSSVVLNAEASPDWAFMSWSGCDSENGTVCAITMSSARSVHATFGRRLSVVVEGEGEIVSTAGGIACRRGAAAELCEEVYLDGASIILQTNPDPLYLLFEWTGDCSGDTDCVLTMDDPREATAAFGLACAHPDAVFSDPEWVGAINESSSSAGPSITRDALALYFSALGRGAEPGLWSIATATRAAAGSPLGLGVSVTELDVPGEELDPSISDDGLEIFFAARPAAASDFHLYCASRASTSAVFSPAVPISALIGVGEEGSPSVSFDRLELFYTDVRNGQRDLWRATRPARDPVNCAAAWTPDPAPLLGGLENDSDPALTADGLNLFFATDRGGLSQTIGLMRRTKRSDFWSSPELVPQLAVAGDGAPAVSFDGCTLYFSSDRSAGGAGRNIWSAQR